MLVSIEISLWLEIMWYEKLENYNCSLSESLFSNLLALWIGKKNIKLVNQYTLIQTSLDEINFFLSLLSWIRMTWFTWRPTTSCSSPGWRSFRTRSISHAAALSSQPSRSSTLTSSVTWLLLMALVTWCGFMLFQVFHRILIYIVKAILSLHWRQTNVWKLFGDRCEELSWAYGLFHYASEVGFSELAADLKL